jgi:hypothetical protein
MSHNTIGVPKDKIQEFCGRWKIKFKKIGARHRYLGILFLVSIFLNLKG